MNALPHNAAVDILFIETTDPACTMFVWTFDGTDTETRAHPASFLTMRFQPSIGRYVENSYLEEGGLAKGGKPDPFHKSALWIARIPASKVDYYRRIVRLSLPHTGVWDVRGILLETLQREGFMEAEKVGEVGKVVGGILRENRQVVLREMEEEARKKMAEMKA
ncbi:hypothetical protein BJY00DRAFT_315347 [Aspergillus carlsbadensis]|nr:hypothetical protein BJY00DRAFT_315347 [Aspergillus carlsbadensis]